MMPDCGPPMSLSPLQVTRSAPARRLADQRREMGEERGRWAQELKQMRGLLESLSKRQVAPQADSRSRQPEVVVEAVAPPTPSASSAGDDPVLASSDGRTMRSKCLCNIAESMRLTSS